MTEEYTRKGSIYAHMSGAFRIRERKGRAYEVELAERPSVWISTGEKSFDKADETVKSMLHSGRKFMKDEKVTLYDFTGERFFIEGGESSYRERRRLFGKEAQEEYYLQKNGYLKNYILAKFGDWDIRRIRPSVIEEWYIGLTSYRNHCQELSNETKINVLETLNDVMQEAVRKGVIDVNPCDSVEKIRVHKTSTRKILTPEELSALFPEDREELMKVWSYSLMWALYFSVIADTGWRPGEVAALTRDRIDANGGVYTMEGVNSRTRTVRNRIKTTGRGKGIKLGVLSDYTMSLLRDYHEESEDGYLFTCGFRPISTAMANRELRRAAFFAGIDLDDRTQYCFRHTFDTNMLNSLGPKLEESDVHDLMAHTGYRFEYDHRTPQQLLSKLQKIKPIVNSIRDSGNEKGADGQTCLPQ